MDILLAAQSAAIAIGEHPNRVPFKLILHQVDRVSARPPQGSGGRRVLIPRAVAQRRLSDLLDMGVNYAITGRDHDPTRKIGVIKWAAIGRDPAPRLFVPGFPAPGPDDVVIAGYLYGKDFPADISRIKSLSRSGALGGSFELTDYIVRDPSAPVWILDDLRYTGAALLDAMSAAYDGTRLAAQSDEEEGMDPIAMEELKTELKGMLQSTVSPLAEKLDALERRQAQIEDAIGAMSQEPEATEEGQELMQEAQAAMDEAADAEEEAREKERQAAEVEAQEMPEEEKAKAVEELQEDADKLHAHAARLRAKARVLQARAAGFGRLYATLRDQIRDDLRAQAKLITDTVVKRSNGLVTDNARKGAGLATDGPGGAQGGMSDAPKRKSLSGAAASLFASKFTEQEQRSGIEEQRLNELLEQAGIRSVSQRIAVKTQLQNAGLLR